MIELDDDKYIEYLENRVRRNKSIYFLFGLSIVLVLLFLILSIFYMNGWNFLKVITLYGETK
jgi:hypothetical protein